VGRGGLSARVRRGRERLQVGGPLLLGRARPQHGPLPRRRGRRQQLHGLPHHGERSLGSDAGRGELRPAGSGPGSTAVSQTGSVGGTVAGTLTLDLGATPSFGDFAVGVAKSYDASTTASVSSTAGEALLAVADPDTTATGHLVNGTFSLPQPVTAKASSADGVGAAFAPVGGSASPTALLSYPGPTTGDAVSIAFEQAIGATDKLRTGSYSKTLTFTLSTDTP